MCLQVMHCGVYNLKYAFNIILKSLDNCLMFWSQRWPLDEELVGLLSYILRNVGLRKVGDGKMGDRILPL